MIRAEKAPTTIIGANADVIKKLLIGWGKVRERVSWNEYAEKIDPGTRDMLAAVFSELRRNGYYNPMVRDDSIIVDYVCYGNKTINTETLSVCACCERDCQLKNWKGIFHNDIKGNEVKKCWEKP